MPRRFYRGNTKAAKLSEEHIRAICDAYENTRVTQAALARMYGVTLSTIQRVLNGSSWQHVSRPPSQRLQRIERDVMAGPDSKPYDSEVIRDAESALAQQILADEAIERARIDSINEELHTFVSPEVRERMAKLLGTKVR